MNHFVEIRSYNLKPGSCAEFYRLFIEEAFPMLKRWNVDVVAYGSSLHDQDSYYLIRRYDNLAHREQSENAFYSSDEWKQGPRETIIAVIEHRCAQRSSSSWTRSLCRGYVALAAVERSNNLSKQIRTDRWRHGATGRFGLMVASKAVI